MAADVHDKRGLEETLASEGIGGRTETITHSGVYTPLDN